MEKLKDTYYAAELPIPVIGSHEITDNLKIGPKKILQLFEYLRSRGCGEIYTQVHNEISDATLYERGVMPLRAVGDFIFVFGETDNAEYDARMAAVQTHQSEQGRARRSSLPFVLDAGWIMPARED